MSTNNDGKSLWQLVRDDLKLKSEAVEVGFFEDATYKDTGEHVAQVAYWNEYGTRHKPRVVAMNFRENSRGRLVFSNKEQATFQQDVKIGAYSVPPRPFMRQAASKSADKALDAAAEEIAAGKGITDALNKAASVMADEIKNEITSLASPANAPSTIRAKGSSNPLMDTGAMRRAVTWRVKGGGND